MRHKHSLAVISIVRALRELTIELTDIAFINIRCVQLRASSKFKLFGFCHCVVRPGPEPTFVVTFQQNDIRLLVNSQKILQDLNVLNPTINIITKENIELIIFDAAVSVDIIL